MQPVINHAWHISELEAKTIQQSLAVRVIKEDQLDEVRHVAGVDVAYEKYDDNLVAAVVILNVHDLKVEETICVKDKAQFPYVPGLFSFRELPPLIKAFAKLQHRPDLVICDGQGIAHPRRLGLASHLGVVFDVPSIGCGKTRLLGEHQAPGRERGSIAPLSDGDEIIGSVLRTQRDVNPIYVSIGHRISLANACNWVLKLSPDYRLPETTRQADQAVRRALRDV